MEQFTLDLTQLTLVEEKDRIKGNWYVVSDYIEAEKPFILQFGSDNRDSGGTQWKFWFLIPPNLPGFPVSCELLDEFELKDREWEFKPDGYETFSSNIMGGVYRRIKPTLPQLTIPSGTKAEQIAAVKKLLVELEVK